MALTFFKIPRNKKYNYRPVYYDQKKEEREKRAKAAYEENSGDYEKALKERLQMRWKRSAGARSRRASNQRLVAIFIIMFLLLYLIFFV
ncbi:MAG: hypothetical protein EA394_02985 [Bacteroidia bacterium]|nr:MAG: hypothetical protein EA394_02985 [Bacteroidia bacterium]